MNDLDWADELAHALYVKVALRGEPMSYETEDNIRDLLRKVRFCALEEAARVARDFPAHRHGHLATTPQAAAAQVANEIAAAIRAMKANP